MRKWKRQHHPENFPFNYTYNNNNNNNNNNNSDTNYLRGRRMGGGKKLWSCLFSQLESSPAFDS